VTIVDGGVKRLVERAVGTWRGCIGVPLPTRPNTPSPTADTTFEYSSNLLVAQPGPPARSASSDAF